MPAPKLLVVDDEPSNLQFLKQVLQEEGYQLVFAKDGAEALARLAAQHFDLVLLDLQMPNIDGFSVLETLRARGKLGLTKVIIVSALDDEESIIHGFSLGALDYVPKPFERKELLLRIRRLLDLKTQQETLLAGYQMMQGGVKAVRGLIQSPLDRAARDAEDSPHFVSVQNDLRKVMGVLQQFELYLGMQGTTLKRSPLNVSELLEAALLTCPGQIHLPLEGPRFMVPKETAINGDGRLLKNSLLTLLDNASRHSIEQEPVMITVSPSEDGAQIAIAISNRCDGIAQSDIASLFTPFVSGKSGRGFGLDLAIASLAVQKHGGKLTCESIPDDWTTFTVQLPILKKAA